ncbi:hypothetical protein Pmani_028135 [Petrolisthes manimaculis]|uniref:Chitin-binding type-2 domain-containing protein n=1 Tax=Petrolisthes manimaculis TaxID=1843537 RepID=A0AAE1P229_9EUCA|nr:hypothetical protein Pmani_028135 [Petrolisthes manimaculis]
MLPRVFTILVLYVVSLLMMSVSVSGHGPGIGQPDTFECPGDGYFADHGRECVVYYKCQGQQVTALGCDEGKKFDERRKRCRLAHLVDC